MNIDIDAITPKSVNDYQKENRGVNKSKTVDILFRKHLFVSESNTKTCKSRRAVRAAT